MEDLAFANENKAAYNEMIFRSNRKYKIFNNFHKTCHFLKTYTACPSTDFFLVRIFSATFSPNMGKYGPEKTPYLDTFHAVISNVTFNFISYQEIFK